MYGKIEFLGYKGMVGEVMYYKDKESFIEEIHESREIGRPINPIKIIEEEHERG